MKKLPLYKAVPPTSDRFHRAMQYALDHLEEENTMQKTTGFRLGTALALALALALMATAFALTNGFGILEYFGRREQPIEPLESAQALVQTDLGSVEEDGWRLALREAVYAGRSVLLMLDVNVPEGEEYRNPECAAMGNTELRTDTILIDGNAPEGVSYRAYMELFLPDGTPEELEISLSLRKDLWETGNGDEAAEDEIEMTVTLPRTQDARFADFAADSAAAAAAGLGILSVRAEYTDLEAVFIIDYLIVGDENHEEFYGTANGRFFHTDPTCQGMKNAEKLGNLEGKLPCPVCVSGDAPVPGGDIATERRVRFHALDAEGQAIASISQWHDLPGIAVSVDAEGRIVRRQILQLQTAEDIPAELFLEVEEATNESGWRAEEEAGEVLYAPIPCRRGG